MNSKKVAYILSSFPTLTETFILSELEELINRNIDVEMFSLKNPKPSSSIQSKALPLIKHTHYLPFLFSLKIWNAVLHYLKTEPLLIFQIIAEIIITHILNPRHLLKTLYVFPKSLAFSLELKQLDINKIHAHWATIPTTVAWIISRLNNCEYTFTAHAWDIFKFDTMLEKKIQCSKAVITCTHFNKHYLIKKFQEISPDKINVIYHGLDFKKFSPVISNGSNHFNILCIGRLSEEKGIHYLLRACSILRESGLEFKCNIIYVPGKFEKTIYDLFSTLKLDDCVEFIPGMPQDQLLEYYKSTDCFVLPCVVSKTGERDGIPNVILEALSMELPVVSTNVSGIPEVIQNKITGLLVEPGDEHALASAILEIYEDKELSRKLGKNGRELIKNNFVISTNIEKIIKIII